MTTSESPDASASSKRDETPTSPDEPRNFVDLYKAVAPSLYGWANLRIHQKLRSTVDPEDILQEVCYRAFDRFEEFDPEKGRFRRWIFGIANNVLREALQSLSRQPKRETPAYLSSYTMDALPAAVTTISQHITRDERIQHFISQMTHLDDEERKLLIFRGFERLSHSDVAGMLGVSVEAAEKRWQRLYKRLIDDGAPTEFMAS